MFEIFILDIFTSIEPWKFVAGSSFAEMLDVIVWGSVIEDIAEGAVIALEPSNP